MLNCLFDICVATGDLEGFKRENRNLMLDAGFELNEGFDEESEKWFARKEKEYKEYLRWYKGE